jgi:uncharacterized protein YbgA (DUF1722 family)/uncharacterized protein YbbK (DUF523 family)
MEKIKIGISSCLLGEKVRYDGGHKWDRYITDTLGEYFDWLPVCPEVEYGLTIPREPMHLVGDPDNPRLISTLTGVDHTEGMLQWVKNKLKILERVDLYGFIFKSRSPSSGIGGVPVYSPSGIPGRKGAGLFGGAFLQRFPFVPAIDDDRLHDPKLRENFLERVFVYKRWKGLVRYSETRKDLVNFHTKHKLLIMSHSPKHLTSLGQIVASSKKYKQENLLTQYIKLLMEGLQLLSTAKKNTNVLSHIAGYFKSVLSLEDKRELLEVIENYHKGYVPLIVPIVLINHYVRKFDESYLKEQFYLNPHPIELLLRNHV